MSNVINFGSVLLGKCEDLINGKMKKISVFLLSVFISITGYNQLNMNELGYLDIPEIHTTFLNDIWGYEDEEGNEYALVGARDGVSIVDISDPATPTEVFWTPGMNSIWRDLKTLGDIAYVTTEALQGLMIIDMSGLPSDTDLPVTLYTGPLGFEWQSAHNLYEKDGYLYIFGANRGNKGVIILDIATDPLHPTEVGVFDNWYVHDGYVVNDTGYFAHIYEGFFSIVDLTDKTSPVLLGTALTPTTFSHNIWASEDGNYVFTTDEVPGGYLGAFDVSDPTNIIELDKIQSSPGNNIVPHNSHVKGNYLYTSYYADGVVIHDITYPHNLVEVANYDTSPLESPTTDGCWGVYHLLPSGVIIGADIQEGLFILDPDEHQGSYLEGNITEFGTGMALNNVSVTIDGTPINDVSNVIGDYATGIESEGTEEVTYFKVLYFPQTWPIEFENGVIVEKDIILEKIPEFTLTVNVLDAVTLEPIEGADVFLQHTYIDHNGTTSALGEAEIPLYYQDNYQFFAGKWGYETVCYVDTMITDELTEITVYLDKGYMDDFTLNFGWIAGGSAVRGFWEREIPVGTAGGDGILENPSVDIGFDCGEYAYMTGNGTTASNTEEVNAGSVQLISPVFDLSDYTDPHLNYNAWFFCQHGAIPDDTMQVFILNGLGDVVLVDKFYNGGLPMSQWHARSIALNPLITVTSNMQVLVVLSDFVETENVTEGAIDNFSITNESLVSVEKNDLEEAIGIYPNPFDNLVTITGLDEGWARIYDQYGRLLATNSIQSNSQVISLPELAPGTYFFTILDLDGNVISTKTQLKL